MTDHDLAVLLVTVTAQEATIRAQWAASAENVPERDQALVAGRHATALKKSLEQWIAIRACRAALTR